MLKHSNSKEGDIIRYTEETLLGPVSPELQPLFTSETRLKSLFYRNGVVYADFSEDAVFPPLLTGNMLNNFKTLHTGILRNFSYVKDVRFFIEGNAVYVEEFKNGGI
jgi:spore germination protein GerM